MTVEEMADELRSLDCPGAPHGNKPSMFDALARVDCKRCVEDALTLVQQEARAAALGERDREWAKAVRAVEMAHFGVLLCHPDGGAEGDAPCVVCPALRALLEGRHEG